ncbi:MAG: UDP-N-acetylmuramoyl-tripeptide--D-alanyl-D-alanine ligase [Bacilli bacterium]|nr:UDP-N-acetylmuramoyl-tripeptide--D-alanyl-D-alanine ligase [Bacilli bacterium]
MKILLIIILLDTLFIISSLFELLMLQQNSYNENKSFAKFMASFVKKEYQVYFLKFLFGICLILFTDFSNILTVFYFVICSILLLKAYLDFRKYNDKLPLKYTKRMIRIMSFDYLLFLVLELLLKRLALPVSVGILMLYITFNSLILIVIVYLLRPVEKTIFNHYKKEALDKLSKMQGINIIGITGSFGKTSTKMILESILSTTYKGFYTPNSFNTPNGLLMTINKEQTIFNDYFIAEMGAKKVGEIKELADLVHPKYGILTSIGAAHLETFKSIDNICKTKFELIESLPSDGVAVLNKDDEYMVNYNLKNNCEVIWIGIENDADVTAKNIKVSNKGTSFDIIFKDSKEKIKANTILLGNKNVYNILASVALAKKLGVTNANIARGISNIAPINHRLEIKEYQNITIIDDAFNSNPVGAKNALDVLSLMDNQKFIITPGMIEMGEEEETLNYEFGKQIASVCDMVFLVGPKHTKPIYLGLKDENYDENDIIVVSSFKEGYQKAMELAGNKKTNILIENDLPDSYTEG